MVLQQKGGHFKIEMEKFSEREWLNSSQESRNPWSSSSTYINVGSLGKIVSLAQRTGQITKVRDKLASWHLATT